MQKGFPTRNQCEKSGPADCPARIFRKNSRNSPLPCREGLAWREGLGLWSCDGTAAFGVSLPRGSVLHSGDFGVFFRLFVFIHIRKRSVFLYFCIVLHFIITGKFYRLFFYSSCLVFPSAVVCFSHGEKAIPAAAMPGSHLGMCWGLLPAPQPLTTHFAHT